MRKIKIVLTAIVFTLFLSNFSIHGAVDLTIAVDQTTYNSGSTIQISGTGPAHTLLTIKALDGQDNLVHLDVVKCDDTGLYSYDLVTSSQLSGDLWLVVGDGTTSTHTSVVLKKSSGSHNSSTIAEVVIGTSDDDLPEFDLEDIEFLEIADLIASGNIYTVRTNAYVFGYDILIPTAMIQENEGDVYTFVTNYATVILPDDLLVDESIDGADYIHLRITRANRSSVALEIRELMHLQTVIDVALILDESDFVWTHKERKVIVKIPYKVATEEDSDQLSIGYVKGINVLETVINGHYDKASDEMVFWTNHLSVFGVLYSPVDFTDFEGYGWAEYAAEVMATKGVTNGTGGTNFSPQKTITRAEFLTMLIRFLELDADSNNNFSDVLSGVYYYKSVGTAKALGIVLGVNGNQFKPNSFITRQDMMVMTGRALDVASLDIGSSEGDAIVSFYDVNKVCDYAYDECNRMVSAELIQGFNGRLRPDANTSRGEVAVFLNRLYNLLSY